MRDKFIAVGNVRARYWEAGEEGPPVVLLHGIGMSVESWGETIDRLAEKHRVFALDQLGFGRTEKPRNETYTPGRLGTFAIDFLDALGLEKAHFIGHSMGGAVAIGVAARWPARVDRLVIIAAGGLGKEVFLPMRLFSLPGIGELLSLPKRSNTERSLRASVLDPRSVPDELIDVIYELNKSSDSRRAFLGILRSAISIRGVQPGRHRQIRAFLTRVKQPMMAIWGEQDNVVPVDHLAPVRSLVDGVRIERIDQCGHFPMWEQPDAFNSLLVDFL